MLKSREIHVLKQSLGFVINHLPVCSYPAVFEESWGQICFPSIISVLKRTPEATWGALQMILGAVWCRVLKHAHSISYLQYCWTSVLSIFICLLPPWGGGAYPRVGRVWELLRKTVLKLAKWHLVTRPRWPRDAGPSLSLRKHQTWLGYAGEDHAPVDMRARLCAVPLAVWSYTVIILAQMEGPIIAVNMGVSYLITES